MGIDAWFKMFDEDLSSNIEVNEIYPMLDSLKMSDKVEERMVMMLFRLFDRED